MWNQLIHNIYFLTGLVLLGLLIGVLIIMFFAWGIRTKNKIFITALLLAAYRFIWHIPLPGIEVETTNLTRGFSGVNAIGFAGEFITIFSGGSFTTASVLSLGLLPFLMALSLAHSIALVRDIPLKMSGQDTGAFIEYWTLILIFPVGVFEVFFLMFLLSPLCGEQFMGMFYKNNVLDLYFLIRTFAILIAGSFFALWVSKLIDAHGIPGQGINLILLSGMVTDLTKEFKDMPSGDLGVWIARLAYLTVMLICMFLFVFLAHGKRDVSLYYPGKRIQFSGKNFVARGSLPLSVNLTTDGLLGGNLLLGYAFIIFPLLLCSNIGFLQSLALDVMSILGRNINWFGPLLFILVFGSTFYYTEFQFMASYFVPRLMASGATIPGINNRNEQHYYLRRIQRSIAFANALGLSLFSIVPWAFMLLTHTSVSLLDAQRWIFIVSIVYEIDAYFFIHRKEKRPFSHLIY